jgi:hypothetical protein
LLSLKSPTTAHNAQIYVPWGINISGAVSLVQLTAGKPVVVEGIAYLPIPPASAPFIGGPLALDLLS